MVRIILTSRFAMWMGWGPDLLFFYNDAYRPTLGRKHDWALGTPAREVWGEIWPAIGPRIDGVLQRGDATWDQALLLFLERSGYAEETYHTFSYSPVQDGGGQTQGMLCVVTEETERVIWERRLSLLQRLASQLATAKTTERVFGALQHCIQEDARDMPFCVAYLFEDGGLRARRVASTGFNAPFGVSHPATPPWIELADARTAWPLRDVFSGAPAMVVTQLDQTIAWPPGPWGKPPAQGLMVPIPQQGQVLPAGVLIIGANPFRALDASYRDFVGLLVGQVAAGLASARAHEEERRRAEALAEVDRAKTAFFSNVSHEFRTPLTLMLGPLADLLAHSHVPAPIQRQLELMHRNGLRLLKLVNTLLDFSRIEAGQVALCEPTDVSSLTADLVGAFRSAVDRAGLTLEVDCAPIGEPVYVDPDMWEKIVLNLVSNAFKFTLQGGVSVSMRRVGERAQLVVRDTGCGIPEHEIANVFNRFHRVVSTRGRTYDGTGIGLALVQELVRLHGGTVQVESVVDQGTTFTVLLPLGSSHLPTTGTLVSSNIKSARREVEAGAFLQEALRWLQDPPEDAPPATAPELATRLPNAEPRERILLVDDNADMRLYVRRLIGTRWDVETASDGAEALAMARASCPDLVITDVMMPKLDGFELLEALRADARTKNVPVIMLSARAGEEARVQGLEAGACDYLAKPFTARELLARIETQLLRGRLRTVELAELRRLADVFSHAPVAIAFLRGPTHVYEMANEHYTQLVGARDLVGKPIRVALPDLRDQGIFELLDQVYATGQPFVGRSFKLLVTRHEGSLPEECFFDFVYQPIPGATGQVEAIAIVAFEVTELARARREAEVANRAKDEFLAMLGHELRNPLAPILTALQLMKLKGVDTAHKERAVIERQVNHLVGLVDDLLDISRITRGKVQLRLERVELADAVVQAVEMASPLLEQHRHGLSINVPRDGLTIRADRARLAQVVSNLLTNAAKYTKPGGSITVVAERSGEQAVLRVRDTGIGIAREMLPQVFEPFAQERQALDRSQGGLGLGLAVVRSLVSLHGGTVAARSEGQGQGSEFTVWLPIAPAGADAVQLEGMVARRIVPIGAPTRVLIVDDNDDAATLLAEMLTTTGYITRCANDAPSALIAAREFDPDVAVLDIGLPVMDGFELARRFGEDPQLRRAKLIAVTGYGQEQDRVRSAAAGFAAHLIKPVDFDALQAALDGVTLLQRSEEPSARSTPGADSIEGAETG